MTQARSQIGGSYELLFTALRINTLQLVMFIPGRSPQPTPFGIASSLGWETHLLRRETLYPAGFKSSGRGLVNSSRLKFRNLPKFSSLLAMVEPDVLVRLLGVACFSLGVRGQGLAALSPQVGAPISRCTPLLPLKRRT
ncbi:hypothetical protein [Nostoc sp. WHI]|uniref:hypothetical protein n=1 Tax=Nostoc sp. WHI TaxID=2650611 RepID=UPI0018C4CE83|nr:hypothetical protein [Nostoc sp. WHI]MBG1265867.1 hypothetical protein [Nostoc sp. WHI]